MGAAEKVSRKKPSWLKVKAPTGERYFRLKKMMSELGLATVCQEARCPNIGECWSGGTATIMLMGEICTRGCRFCAVKTGNPKGLLDTKEPEKVGYAVAQMDIDYVVLTSVDRDDLKDQGASHFAQTVRYLKLHKPSLLVEVLTPDFRGDEDCIKTLVQAGPDVFAHNVETVERLQRPVRDPRANYGQSLRVLESVKKFNPDCFTKTSLMLGLGETEAEIEQTLQDLRTVGCDVITFGQYLQPTSRHLNVNRFYSPAEFEFWRKKSEELGFVYSASGALVRSSYRAGEYFMKAMIDNKKAKLK